MKKLLASFAVVAALLMTSCYNESNISKNMSDSDKLCICETELLTLTKELNNVDEKATEEIFKKMFNIIVECDEITSKMEEGKSNEEIIKMRTDLAKNCDALKELEEMHKDLPSYKDLEKIGEDL